jgi:integrase/recombinase XerD
MKAYLDPEEIYRMEQAATNLRDKIMIHLLFRLGCRISEALSVEVNDIDFKQGTIMIVHLKRRIKLLCPACTARLGVSYLFCPKCGNRIDQCKTEELQHHRQRIIPVGPDTLKRIKEYISRGGPVIREGKQLIFGINRHRAWQIVKQCADNSGLPKLINPETGRVHNVSPHKLRDAFAVNAVKRDGSGDGLRLLQEHLGHQSFNTTAKYRKVSGEEQQQWYQRLWEQDRS